VQANVAIGCPIHASAKPMLGFQPMEESQQLTELVRLLLGRADVPVDDIEVAVIATVEQIYGAKRDALLAADLSDVMPEYGFHPGRPPADPEGRTVHGA
jgi:hypothetical protein